MAIDFSTTTPNLKIGGAFRTLGRDNDQIGKEARGFHSIKNPVEDDLHRLTGSVDRQSTEPPKASDNQRTDPVLKIGSTFRTPGGTNELLGAEARGFFSIDNGVADQAHKLTGSVERAAPVELPGAKNLNADNSEPAPEIFASDAEAFVSKLPAPSSEEADIKDIKRTEFLGAHGQAEEAAEDQFG